MIKKIKKNQNDQVMMSKTLNLIKSRKAIKKKQRQQRFKKKEH